MKWFKHQADASEGNSLTQIFEDFRHEGLAVYWLLIELLATKYTVEHAMHNGEKFEFHEKILRKKLRISSTKVDKYLENFQHLYLLNYKKVGNSYFIEMPKLRAIRDEHTTRVVKTPECLPSVSVLDIEIEKDKEVYINKLGASATQKAIKRQRSAAPKVVYEINSAFACFDASLKDLISKVNEIAQANIVKAYPDILFLEKEFSKMVTWMSENPQKVHSRSKWGTFVNNWLDRGWQRHLKYMQSNKPGKIPALRAEDLPD